MIASVAMDLLESATRPSMSSWHLDTLSYSMFKTCYYGDHRRHDGGGKGGWRRSVYRTLCSGK